MRSMAAWTSVVSAVGGWTVRPASLKATTPMMTPSGRRSTMALATALAASIRDGETSPAAMLPDTSKVSISVPSRWGSATVAWGRARPTASTTSAATTRAAGSRSRIARRAGRPRDRPRAARR